MATIHQPVLPGVRDISEHPGRWHMWLNKGELCSTSAQCVGQGRGGGPAGKGSGRGAAVG